MQQYWIRDSNCSGQITPRYVHTKQHLRTSADWTVGKSGNYRNKFTPPPKKKRKKRKKKDKHKKI